MQRTEIHEGPAVTDAEFARQKEAALAEVFAPRTAAAPKPVKESKPKKSKAKEKSKAKAKQLAETVTPPYGTLAPPQDGDAPKPWELSPQDLRAQMDKALWPTDGPGHTWTPRPPMSLSDFVKNGV
jgi:hypothetical protein